MNVLILAGPHGSMPYAKNRTLLASYETRASVLRNQLRRKGIPVGQSSEQTESSDSETDLSVAPDRK